MPSTPLVPQSIDSRLINPVKANSFPQYEATFDAVETLAYTHTKTEVTLAAIVALKDNFYNGRIRSNH